MPWGCCRHHRSPRPSPGAGAAGGDSQGRGAVLAVVCVVVTLEEYRAELAALLGEAAALGRIPRTFRAHSRALVVDFSRPAEAAWYVHKLARSDSRAWWAAVQPYPPHFPGIMPEFGAAIGELRALHRVTDVEIRAATALHRLRLRLFGPITPADMPQHRACHADVTSAVTPVD